jgi:UDP-GlcNAc:undecaprenyl-phosphate GlcNAc-1-phosphate transferase
MNLALQEVTAHWPSAFVALAAAMLAAPLAARVARRLGVMDHPDEFLKPHARATPYLGGLAVGAGWLLGCATALLWTHPPAQVGFVAWPMLLPVMAAGLTIMALGLADDVSDLPPGLRLAASAAVVATLMLASGIGLRLVDVLAGPWAGHIHPLLAVTLALPLGVFIVLGACNSTNLIDGLDGLCAGVTAVMAAGFLALGSLMAARAAAHGGDGADGVRLALAWTLLGATLGFLPFNVQPARIFLGDAGSMLLGFNCGVLILLSAGLGELRHVLGAIVIFGLPIFDTTLAMFRRWRTGKPIFQGDRSHFYDQLVQRGFTVPQTAVVCYGVAALFAGAGLAIASLPTGAAIVAAGVVAVGTALVAWRCGLTSPPAPAAR